MDIQFPAHSALQNDATVPLCVDLDGTLTFTDSLLETLLLLLRRNPFHLLLSIAWLARGKAHFKEQVAQRVSIDAGSLPYNNTVVEFLRTEAARGRTLYLCTGANERVAAAVATHFAFFTGIVASDHRHNLTNHNKAARLVGLFGQSGFDYVGNERSDIPAWRQARTAIVVGDRAIINAARRVSSSVVEFEQKRALLKLAVREMRVYQWVKNLMVFVPLLASHRYMAWQSTLAAAVAFLSFSLCASSVYLLNDMLDLASDRAHARKRHRPFASGQLPLLPGGVLMLALLIVAFVLAASVGTPFMAVLLGYFILTLAYSFALKRKILIDVFALATLYTLRIAAGGAACGIDISMWLTLFSVTLFLSLAMVKRYAELNAADQDGMHAAAGRGYKTGDIEMLRSLGTSAGYLAPLVLALYINSPEVSKLYTHPQALWMLFGLLLYWISRVWFVAFHGKMHDDPIVFAFRDKVSRVIFLLCALCVSVAV